METKSPARGSIARSLAPPVWLIGAFISSVVALAVGPLAGAGSLGITAVMTLLLARRAIGWRSVPVVFVALAAQAPIVSHAGMARLTRWDFWEPSSLEAVAGWQPELLLLLTLGAVVLASPFAFVMLLGQTALQRLQRVARLGAPPALVGALVLVGLGSARVARFPDRDAYTASLPVHATLAGPAGQACEALTPPSDPRHDEREGITCVTPDVEAVALSFHYHCRRYESELHRSCTLMVRAEDGGETAAGYFSDEVSSVLLRRDDSRNAWLIQHRSGRAAVIVSTGKSVQSWYIRTEVAPPLGWLLFAAGGILIALACAATALGARRLVAARTPASTTWLAKLRGDLSIVAFASLVFSNALLFAALLSGYLL